MKLYDGKSVDVDSCPGCMYRDNKFSLSCGKIYEDDYIIISQDWELPIPGFIIISTKRCINYFSELTGEEKLVIFDMISKIENILSDIKFNIVLEEKDNCHFHIWMMPKYNWMYDINKDIIGNIRSILEYSKDNMRCEDNFNKIDEISKVLRKSL